MKTKTNFFIHFLIIISFSLTFHSASYATQATIEPSILQQANVRGKIPVIIRLKVDSKPAELLSAASEQIQKDNIQSKRKALLSRLSKYKPKNMKKFEHVPFTAMELDTAGLNAATSDPDVEGIYEDKLIRPSLIDSTMITGATVATISGVNGSGQVVAILDTGVDSSHPFLANKVIHEACFSKTLSGSTSVCPNGSNSQIGTGSAAPCTISGCNHGTHVAGIVAGKGSSFSGIAPEANIMAIQVFSQFDASSCGGSPCVLAYTSDLISGLEHVYSQRNNYNIAAVNMSLGGGSYTATCDDSPLKDAIDLLKSANIATVVASGNNGYTTAMSFPACISTAISIGATTKTDAIASYSNSASFLDLLAPGSSIQSSVPGAAYAYMSGTSMATPHVAGAFAALRSIKPNATIDEILNTLKLTGKNIIDTRNNITKPRIQLDAALLAMKSDDDFDGDGKEDIVWRNTASGNNQLYLMDGISIANNSTLPQITDTNWKIAGIGDLDGDGNADILWRHAITGLNWIHLMKGSNIITSKALNTIADPDWKVAGMGDLDGNGTADIVWRNYSTGMNWVYLMNGVNIIKSAPLYTVADLQWKIDAIADLDGNGKSDILWRNHGTGMNWVYFMDGTNISVSSYLNTVSDVNWEIVGVNDLNGDGKADILWRHNITGLNWIHLMNGATVTTSSALNLIPDTNWKAAQMSDFNGDGKADIFWRNAVSGLNWEYIMDGTNVLQSSAVNTVADPNWKIIK